MTGTAMKVASEEVRRRLQERGLALPRPWALPPDVSIPASLVRVVGTQLWASGHLPIEPDGRVTAVFGKVGADVDLATAQDLAVRAMLGIVASVERVIGDLGRIRAWCRLHGMVNAAAGFTDFPAVLNPASQLLRDVFGSEIGDHARVAGLPWDSPVEIEAEAQLTRE